MFDLPHQPPLPNPESEAYAARALALSASLPETVERVAVESYGPSPYQRVAVFRPREPSARPLPLVMVMHGGGWTHGHKEWVMLAAAGLCPAPAIVAAVGYRLAPEARHPTPLLDCIAAAVRLREIAPAFGGNPDRLVVSGHSAGGQLAALMALRPGLTAAHGLPAGAIRACLPVSGMFDLRDFVFDDALPPTLARAEDIAGASPVDLAANARVPFLVAWGGDDYEPIVASNRKMVAALGQAGAGVAAVAYPGLDHYEVALAAADPAHDWCRRAAELIATA